MGSFSGTEDVRRDAIERPLGLIEDLLAACSAWDTASAVSAVAEHQEISDAPDDGHASKRGRKRRKSSNGKTAADFTAVDKADGGGDGGGDSGAAAGGEADGGCIGVRNEMAVLRAYALEAAVGLCCLFPSNEEEDGGNQRGEILERLVGWHGRWNQLGVVRACVSYFCVESHAGKGVHLFFPL